MSLPNFDAWLEPPDDDERDEWEPDPDEARQRGIDEPDLFDSRGRLYREDD